MSTITKEFTKKQLIEQAKSSIERYTKAVAGFPRHLNVAMDLELARIALASLEADPVMYLSRQNTTLREQFGTCDDWEINARLVEADFPAVEIPESDNYEFMPLYTAPPAPVEAEPVAYMWDSDRKDVDAPGYYRPEHKVFAESSVKRYGGKVVALYAAPPAPESVPDERVAFNAWNNDTDCPIAGRDAKTAAWLAWSRRAAMLQGADGNSPVIPDGWVACSERMPDETGDIIVVSDGIVMSGISYSRRKGFYMAALEYDDDEPIEDVTHWMPLPAAPQQEVRS